MAQAIEIRAACAPRNGEDGLRENWASWTPSERATFVEGLSALGWIPQGGIDLESPAYPGFVALPGNACYVGLAAGPMGPGGSPGDPFGQGGSARSPSGFLDWLRALLARLSQAVRDALARLLAMLGGPWLLIIAALMIGGGVLLAARDRKRA